jgi:hypothetical protein
MKTPVEEFESILLATSEFATSMEKANMSILKLLQKEVARNPNPVGINAFLRITETVRRAWSVLQRQGKAPTRKAHDGGEEQQMLARVKTQSMFGSGALWP